MDKIPEKVIICGIEYRVQAHEGLVTFVEAYGIWGHYRQISFERDKDGMCWYVSIQDNFGNKIMVDHIVEAYALVTKHYGKNFEKTCKE